MNLTFSNVKCSQGASTLSKSLYPEQKGSYFPFDLEILDEFEGESY